MRSAFFGLETARKAITASQKAMDITMHNIANAQTKGYTRQRLDLVSIDISRGGKFAPAQYIGNAGAGVLVSDITQVRDPLLDNRYRQLNATAYDAGMRSDLLSDIEDVVDDVGGTGLTSKLEDFLKKLQNFSSSSADSAEHASTAQMSAQNVLRTLRDYAKDLQGLTDTAKTEVDQSVLRVNEILKGIQEYNQQIFQNTIANGPTANELYDKRNVLLDELSQYMDFTVEPAFDNGVSYNMIQVKVNTDSGSVALVDGRNPALQMEATYDATSGLLTFTADGGAHELKLGAGGLNGYMEILNGTGSTPDNKGLPYYQETIDAFTRTFAQAFNEANGAVDADNKVIDASKLLFSSDSGGVADIAADNIRIADAWKDDPLMIAKIDGKLEYTDTPQKRAFPFKPGTEDATLLANMGLVKNADGTYSRAAGKESWWVKDSTSVIGWKPTAASNLFTETNGVWAPKDATNWSATDEYALIPSLDTTQLAKIIGVFDKELPFTLDVGSGSTITKNYKLSGYVSSYTGDLANDISSFSGRYESSAKLADGILDERDAVSGVSTEDEAVSMLNYQKWFNASSRILTAFDEMLDVIINSMGLVGR